MDNQTATLAKEEYFGIDINEQNIGPTNIYHIETCPLVSLTVYRDKAELCRTVKPQLKLGKISMVVFKKISNAIFKNSFRVEVSGSALIRDVFYKAVPIPDDERNSEEKRNFLQSENNEYQKKLKLLNSKLIRLKTQRSVIDGFSETLVEKRDDEFKSRTCAFDPMHMETLKSFLHLYDNQVETIDSELMQTQEEINRVQELLTQSDLDLKSLELKSDEQLSRELTVMLECKELDTTIVSLSYVVGSCQWTPSYDIRVYSNDGNMKIIYYGQLQQNTGEDWEPQTMFLSSASPGIGENAPELLSQSIKFKDNRKRPQKITKAKRMTKALSFHAKDDKVNISKLTVDEISNLCFSDDNLPSKEFELLKSPAKEFPPGPSLFNGTLNSIDKEEQLQKIEPVPSKTSTTTATTPIIHFTVPKPPTIIPGDELPHRTLVGVIDLHPSFEYVTVPKKTPYAFLKAKCHNGSPFAILPGPANVFIDNNFIGKTSLNSVAPQEEFLCNLGVDQGIKIIYKPIFKYRESTSSNSRTVSLTFKQLIEIKNLHDLNIHLIVKDQLPVSSEDKIKIHLHEPLIKQSDKNKLIRLTKSNVVEWEIDMHPCESKELTLKYSIEYPINEEIDVALLNAEL